MAIRFVQGEVRRLLSYFNMNPVKKCSFIYSGIGRDGKFRTCKFDYHKDRDVIPPGTASAIRKSLLLESDEEMKRFIDNI